MRSLLVMRHAKSSWSTGRPDYERPLNARGRRDAPRMAHALANRQWVPELVYVSTAERTRETLAWMESALGHSLPAEHTERLYLASREDFCAVLTSASDEVRHLMVIAHNPGCEDLILYLTGHDVQMTTANAARLVAPDRPWRELLARPLGFELEGVLRPGDLPPDDGDVMGFEDDD